MLIEHFAYIAKYANDAIFVADESGTIIEANELATEVYGYAREEFLQMQVLGFRDPSEDPAIAKGQMERIKGLGELRYESVNRRKDGTTFSVEVRARYIESQGVKYMQVIIRDLSESRRAGDALRKSEECFRSMADKAPIMIWVAEANSKQQSWNRHDCRTFFNQRWHDFTGLPPDQSQNHNWQHTVHPEDRARCLDACEAAFRNAHPFKLEYRLRRHDGAFRWVLDAGEPRFTEDGKMFGFIGTCVDVTDQKLFEEMRSEVERNGRINIIGEMTSALAHELSQPLSAASIYLDGCLNRMAENDWDEEKLHNAVRQAHAQTQRAGKIIGHLKELMRKQGRKRDMMDINSVIKDSVNFLEHDLKRYSVAVIHDFCDLPLVSVNRIEIEQVLFNLMKNAIDSMSSQVRRKLRLATRFIKSGMIMVTVSDTGAGIPQNELDNIFNPFQTTKQNGLGLGLGICRSLVENHGGQIWAEQRSDCGMEFNFTLPVVVMHE